MSSSSRSSRKGLGTRAKMLVLGVAVACMGVFAFAGQANAANFNTTYDNGVLNLGFAFKKAPILPAPAMLGANQLPNLWNPPTFAGPQPDHIKVVNGDKTGAAVTIPMNQFQPPIMQVPNPLSPGDVVPITLRSTSNLEGTFDDATGKMTLKASAGGVIEFRVLVALGAGDPTTYCSVPLPGFQFSTDYNSAFGSSPFTSGIEGNGALSGTFSISADSTITGPQAGNPTYIASCGDVNTAIKGSGSLWISHGIAAPLPAPKCETGTTGTYPNCVPDPCPAGTTGTPPDCVPVATDAKINKVSVKAPKKVKQGKKGTYKITISNSGGSDASGVKVKLSGKGIGGKSSVGTIAAGGSKTVKIKTKFKKPGKIKATIKVTSSNAGSKSAKATTTVKKNKKKKNKKK